VKDKNCIFSALAVLALVLCAAKPAACGIKIELPGEVVVSGQSIFLSDLLPQNVPVEVRNQARGVLIAVAPHPGSTRILEGRTVAKLMGTEMAGELDIPQQIVVRRAARLITREEVVAAIRGALSRNGFSDPNMQPDDLRIFPSSMVSTGDAQLQVRQMDFDKQLKQARFLMAEQGSLPFLVTAVLQNGLPVRSSDQEIPAGNKPTLDDVRPKIAAANAATIPQRSQPEDSAVAHTERFVPTDFVGDAQRNSAVLVGPGKVATLLVTSGETQMLLEVTPLERGSLHQVIRVKLPLTGKVLQAKVTANGHLEAIF
jgi:flagella basal body P-ring formation protein FlgA